MDKPDQLLPSIDGKWEGFESATGRRIEIIFHPDGKFEMSGANGTPIRSDNQATATYRISNSVIPHQIDLSYKPSDEKMAEFELIMPGIFEFRGKDTLIINLTQGFKGVIIQRPENFEGGRGLLELSRIVY